MKRADIFKKELGAEVIVKHAMGHFSGAVENKPACVDLPEVAESAVKLSAR